MLDNVQSPEMLERLLPQGGNGRVLITTRDRALSQFGPVLAVDVFDEDTATRYLTERAERLDDEPGARELARALGCLPLALAHAAAYCGEGTSFTDYRLLLDGLPAVELFDSQPDLSYAADRRVDVEAVDRGGDQARTAGGAMLDMAAYLAPDAIPKSLFDVLVDDRTPAGKKRLADAFNALARYSLATVDDSTDRRPPPAAEDHPRRPTSSDELPRRCAGADRAVAARSPSDVQLRPAGPLCEQLLPHALALADTLGDPGDRRQAHRPAQPRVALPAHADPPGGRSLATTEATLAHARGSCAPIIHMR